MRAVTSIAPQACSGIETWPSLYTHVKHAIHDEIMQSIGVCLLEADLCRQLWQDGRGEEALQELNAMHDALRSAVEVLRHVLGDLALAAEKS